MINKFSLCCIFAICILAIQGCQRQSMPLDPSGVTLMGIEKDGTFSLVFEFHEKLKQPPVVLLKRQPKIPGEIQRFDLSLYRKVDDMKEESEIIFCQPKNIAENKDEDGTIFVVSIPFSHTDECPFELFVNGANSMVIGKLHVANYILSEQPDDTPDGETSP